MLAPLTRLTSCHFRRFFGASTHRFQIPNKMTENGEPHAKKKVIEIGTHDGTFHCDEALACYMLRRLPEYESAKIVRTRNEEVLRGCDIVVDVGGVYDPKTHRYDHHQRTFDRVLNDVNGNVDKKFTIKLSSAGLVYAHFGERLIAQITSLNDEGVRAIYEKVYEYFIQEVDAIDNGVPMCDGEQRYKISTNLSARVANINPPWNFPSPKSTDELFEEAVTLTGSELVDKINYYSKSWWPAKNIVKKSIENRFNVHASGRIVELEEFVPWKQHFFDLEKEMKIDVEINFFIFKDKSWRVIAVPVDPDSFICRKFLNKEWWGVRDDQLSKLSGIPGCVFCHQTGFIGGNNTREGAIEMAVKSL